MVLPAPIADAVRGMASGGRTSAASLPTLASFTGGTNDRAETIQALRAIAERVSARPSEATSAPMQVTVHAVDSKSFEDFARRNPAAFAKGVQAAIRNGQMTRARAL